jgi:sulfate adenylyltransferase subunit 1
MSTEIDTARAAALLDEAPLAHASLFRFATAGSVDDGKSTLVGRLLHDSKAILADQLDAVARTSADRGFGGAGATGTQAIDLALLTDVLRA